MPIETHQGHVPTNAHGARPVLSPAGIVTVCDVLELEVRAAVCVLREIDLDPAHLPYELPRHRKMARRLATRDLAAGVTLELIAAAQTKVAGDRQEPARNALGAGNGVPDILDRRVVASAGDYYARRTTVVLAIDDLPGDCSDQTADVKRHHMLP